MMRGPDGDGLAGKSQPVTFGPKAIVVIKPGDQRDD